MVSHESRAPAAGQGGDEEFDKSLGDFDRQMGREQESAAREGGGAAADAGVSSSEGGVGGEPGGVPGEGAGQGGGSNDAAAIRDLGPDTEAAVTIQGCNDQDRVARQLCEAATEENDPFLRAALWDEYNEYKKLIARD